MKIDRKELTNCYQLAKETSIEAGDYLLSRKNQNLVVHSETGRDIKLEIDRETEELIRNKLSLTGISVLGEELGSDKIKSQLKWIVDPLDGTSNYFRGLDQCCVSIALMDREEVLLGIIFNFNTNELFSARKGGGAFLNDKKIKVSEIHNAENASLTTGFPASESLESSALFLKNFSGWKKIRMFGSAALSCAYVASGRCDVYQEKGVYLWDFAAGICLVEEAGGKTIYKKIDDSRYSVNFTNGKL
jgi:myo-inositol-1(or 4)-monophosphatase